MVKMIPMAAKVLLLMDKDKPKKAGAIIFTDNTSKQLKTYETGVIVAMGDAIFNYAPESKELCHIGDRVYIIKFAGIPITENAGYTAKSKDEVDNYRVINDEDILIVEGNDD